MKTKQQRNTSEQQEAMKLCKQKGKREPYLVIMGSVVVYFSRLS